MEPASRPEDTTSSLKDRIPRCPECGQLMRPEPYGWWACAAHPWRMAPDVNHPDHDRLLGAPTSR